ncbi:hypothetical protein A3A21_01630 [Candidatus Jorgensenbacteria bacterium RIFCSPLOWO2_01_FULL_45_25b]|uniref:Metallo-beta-lactamase domain-containing protein n=1 Tax=Candidatus Jorgensenbacteria bacterium RIFCSPLOWO2_01_FULL_45_25b TaxID=1798471 RepID=A0A1F6BTD2_9BACT|nr:MAG: hypothetical protein A3A21_01630 [Candidatus Jorgensenbacteria bacterium RIFCSPLOWO2_01_FULL_45_25b]
MEEILNVIQKKIQKRKTETGILICSVLLLTFLLYGNLIKERKENNLLRLYFLNVGQGDSELILLPGGASILIDAGPPNKKALEELSKILSPFQRTIDIVSPSHFQLDHMGGLPEVMKRYKVGAILSNGETSETSIYQTFVKTAKKENIPNIAITKGDKIKYKESVITVLHPPANSTGKIKDINESSLVLQLKSKGVGALFTGDAGATTEKLLLQYLEAELPNIDILKVPHHGSRFSSTKEFLKAVSPKIAIIEVGKNTYGHPTPQTLKRLEEIGAKIYRTDRDGTIQITTNGKILTIKTIK